MMRLFALTIVLVAFLVDSIVGEDAVLVYYNKENDASLVNATCSDYEHSELRYAMYRSVGYDNRRLSSGNICNDWCEAYHPGNCQVIHPLCQEANSTATMVGYITDSSTACEELVLNIDQALDLLSSAMSSSCEQLVNARSYQCIIQK